MPSIFNARDADSYEQTMGRWSRRLAPLFIEHAGVAAGERLLEVGCGTGSLTFALAGAVAFGELTAIDYADVYVAAARARIETRASTSSRGTRSRCASPTRTSIARCRSWSCTSSPSRGAAVAQMRRVTRPGEWSPRRSGIPAAG